MGCFTESQIIMEKFFPENHPYIEILLKNFIDFLITDDKYDEA
jgi:hypothetical protein